ncbi:MAG: pyrroline-5-carboxylate reductase [Lentisphaerae bacterium]|nr:pyrroline-5-carboxylate reductase [Lentisphaerota bacterium]
MGVAIIAEFVNSGFAARDDIVVSEIDEQRRNDIQREYNVVVMSDNTQLLDTVDVVFLCVKPQALDAVLSEIADGVKDEHLVISIAAGKRLAGIEGLLARGRVVRVMPNLPAVVSQAMSVFCAGERVSAEDREQVKKLLSCIGKVLELPEEKFDAVTALSGSGPAFFAYFTQVMAQAGMELGLAETDAELLAGQTLLGTATLLANGTFTAQSLIDAVSSKKGTTVAGREVLENSDLAAVIHRALAAAAHRSAELSGG